MINVLSIRYVKVYTMEDIFKKEMITPNPNFVKKFYFLDYFYTVSYTHLTLPTILRV